MAHHAINKLDSPLGNVDQNWKMAFLRAVISTTTAVGALGADHQPKFMGLSTSSVRYVYFDIKCPPNAQAPNAHHGGSEINGYQRG